MALRIDPKTGKLNPTGIFTDLILTSAVSFIIAVVLLVTELAQDFLLSALICHAFNMSCAIMAIILDYQKPFAPKWKKMLLSWTSGIMLGVILSTVLIQNSDDAQMSILVGHMSKPLLLALVMGTFVSYFFYSRDNSAVIKHKLNEAQLQKTRHEKALLESQLKALQSQIEPHFLFNTLANIQAMIHHEPKIATDLLNNLTDLLRQSLTKSRQDMLSIEDEVAFLKAYLEIQKIRLGERLAYQINLAPELSEQLQLPPLLVQPLIENAVKHGIEPSTEGGEVIVLFRKELTNLIIEIKDNGVGFSHTQTKGNGIALNNIRNRLNSLFNNRASLRITENPEGGVCSTIKIPLDTIA